ncbi:hypothetical protein [Gordonia sp. (in: high G+C Gram-positive bacteria)]|uniref:hypothetical protein n=1 Tax=Gordonia sp. (in: high G+C Gram-positive bacteria) TaxID=84139 RepID=UPI003C70B4C3
MTTFRRSAAVIAAGTAALAFAGVTAGSASAETVGPVSGENDTMKFQRSVSGDAIQGTTVHVGDTITVTNRIDRKLAWMLYSVKDVHPTCMEAVPETSVWTVSGKTYRNVPGGPNYKNEITSGPGWVKVTGGTAWTPPLVWSQDYIVNCDPGDLNTGGVEWKSTNEFEKNRAHPDAGPSLTVVKRSNPGGGNNGGGDNGGGGNGGGSGSLDTGSLSSLFG